MEEEVSKRRKAGFSKSARKKALYTGDYPAKLSQKQIPAFPKPLKVHKKGG